MGGLTACTAQTLAIATYYHYRRIDNDERRKAKAAAKAAADAEVAPGGPQAPPAQPQPPSAHGDAAPSESPRCCTCLLWPGTAGGPFDQGADGVYTSLPACMRCCMQLGSAESLSCHAGANGVWPQMHAGTDPRFQGSLQPLAMAAGRADAAGALQGQHQGPGSQGAGGRGR